MSMLTDPQLFASYHTISGSPAMQVAHHPFEARVAAAATAGLKGMGILVEDYLALLANGHTPAGLRSIVDTYGVTVPEIEVLMRWDMEGDEAKPFVAYENHMYAIAETLGCRRMDVVLMLPPNEMPPMEKLVERFAALCDRAARQGLTVAIEPIKLTCIANLDVAVELVNQAGRSNGGIVLDTFHFFRGGGQVGDLLRAPAGMIKTIQISDASAEEHPSYMEELTEYRRLPGQGALDLAGFLCALDNIGVDVEIGIEVLSRELRPLPPAQVALLAAQATRALFLKAAREQRAH